MIKTKNPYQSFDKFVVRSPLLSLNFYKELTHGNAIDNMRLKKICKDYKIREAIFLASPSLYFEFEKWLNEELTNKKEVNRLTNSILKYLSRMSSRCTPFGIFAGCGVGEFSRESDMKLKLGENNKRHTRLDMNYLVALSQDLIKNKHIRDQLLFFSNTSIYKAGDFLRYIEYYHVNSKRYHQIISVDHTEYLQEILDASKNGVLLKDLVNLLVDDLFVDDEINKEEALAFIEEMVGSQLLISELEPSVTGDEFLSQILKVLKKLEGVEDIILTLESVNNILENIDRCIGNERDEYVKINKLLKKIGTDFDVKYLFQTDMILDLADNKLSDEVVNKVKKGISFFNKISPPMGDTNIKKFREAFYERYENREVKLSQVLDTEMGIGYLQDQGSGTVNPLVDDLFVGYPSQDSSMGNIPWNGFYSLLYKKLNETILKKAYSLKLEDKDFESFQKEWNDLPDTLSVMTEITIVDGKEMIFMHGAGGSSAANLFGRFCHGDTELHEYTKTIINSEGIINKGKIMAEIIHLPESRVGNILARPILREYEIPYLAKSSVNEKNQLILDDLMVSIKNNKEVFLRSKKNNKQVIPYLTNAHNYSSNSLPVYHFLSDMQLQNKRVGIGFNWGPLVREFEFLPRVTYDDIIFSKATWNFKKASIQPFIKLIEREEELLNEFSEWRVEKQLPQYVKLIEGDNELLVCLTNVTSIKMFLNTVKNKATFVLSEFLFSEEGILKGDKEYYSNQVVISFYNEEKLNVNK